MLSRFKFICCKKNVLLQISGRSIWTSEISQYCLKRTFASNVTLENNSRLKHLLWGVGVSEEESDKIIERCPDISNQNEDRMAETAETLMRCQFGKNSLVELIKKHPYILCVDSSTIRNYYQQLCVEFSKPVVFKLLMKSPNILNDNWSDVQEKIQYLEEDMGLTRAEIASCGVLNYPLNFIKQRHIFLVRTGFFKKFTPKISQQERLKLNPKLNLIFNSTDLIFSEKVAHVSLAEYEVFQQLFESENE